MINFMLKCQKLKGQLRVFHSVAYFILFSLACRAIVNEKQHIGGPEVEAGSNSSGALYFQSVQRTEPKVCTIR